MMSLTTAHAIVLAGPQPVVESHHPLSFRPSGRENTQIHTVLRTPEQACSYQQGFEEVKAITSCREYPGTVIYLPDLANARTVSISGFAGSSGTEDPTCSMHKAHAKSGPDSLGFLRDLWGNSESQLTMPMGRDNGLSSPAVCLRRSSRRACRVGRWSGRSLFIRQHSVSSGLMVGFFSQIAQ